MKNFTCLIRFKLILTLVTGLLYVNEGNAQYFSDTTYYKEPLAPPKVILKLDLLSFFDTYSNLLIDVEYRVKPTLYLQHGIGIVTGFNDYDFDEDEFINNPVGFKFRNEVRFYLDFARKSQKGFYLAPELLYGYVFGDEEQVLGINCDEGCDFFRLMDFKAVRQEAAVHFKIGNQRIYRETFSLDYFLGLGYKYKWFDVSGLDLNSSEVVRREDLHPESDFRYSVTIGFKIGLVLK